MADRRAQYEELLKRAGVASGLASYLDSTAGGTKGSTHEGNLWAAARLLANGLSHFLNHLIVAMVESIDRAEESAGAQEALDLVPESRAANARDLRLIVENFLSTERLDHDDAGRREKPAEPTAEKAPASDAAEKPAEPTTEKAPKAKGKGRKKAAVEPETGPSPREAFGEPLPAPTVPKPSGDASEAAMILDGLAELGRFSAKRPPVDVIRAWSSEDRSAALAWIQDQRSGGQAPPPEVLASRFLEELDLEQEHDQNDILTRAGVAFAAAISLETQADFDRLMAWAVGRVRFLRGENVAVPDFPFDLLFDPKGQIFAAIHAQVVLGGDVGVPEAVVEEKFEPNPAFRIALEVLSAAGEILLGDGRMFATSPKLETKIADLIGAAMEYGGQAAAEEPTGSEGLDPIAEGERLAEEEFSRRAQEAASRGDARAGSDVHAETAEDSGESSEAELEAERERIRNAGATPAEPRP